MTSAKSELTIGQEAISATRKNPDFVSAALSPTTRGDPAASTFAAGPIEGVVVFVNLNTKKVFRFIDSGVVSPPKSATAPGTQADDHPRDALKPLRDHPAGGSELPSARTMK